MTVTLNKNDIVKILNDKYGMDLTVNDLIILDEQPLYIKSILQVQKEFPNYLSNQKISAIKRLRELCPMGLVEAKSAVENIMEACQYFRDTGMFYKGNC